MFQLFGFSERFKPARALETAGHCQDLSHEKSALAGRRLQLLLTDFAYISQIQQNVASILDLM